MVYFNDGHVRVEVVRTEELVAPLIPSSRVQLILCDVPTCSQIGERRCREARPRGDAAGTVAGRGRGSGDSVS
jgi:hypothetical protein